MAALAKQTGAYITPTRNSGELALSGRVAQVKELAASVADPAGAGAYPITTYSWMFLYGHYPDQVKVSPCETLPNGAFPRLDKIMGLSLAICRSRMT